MPPDVSPPQPPITTQSTRRPLLLAVIGLIIFISAAPLWLMWQRDGSENQEPVPSTYIPGADLDPELLLLPVDENDQTTVEFMRTAIAVQSVPTDTITLTGACSMEPRIARLTSGASLKIDNKDSRPHTISFGKENYFIGVPPNFISEVNITEVFGISEGIYRYRCSDLATSTNVGVFYVTK